MEEAFKQQALELEDDALRQNRELGDCMEQLEGWQTQDRFCVELHGRIEALQVHLFPWGVEPC